MSTARRFILCCLIGVVLTIILGGVTFGLNSDAMGMLLAPGVILGGLFFAGGGVHSGHPTEFFLIAALIDASIFSLVVYFSWNLYLRHKPDKRTIST